MSSFFADKENFVNIGLQKEAVVFYELTDSTNTRARDAFLFGEAAAPMLFVADGQSAGRGTRGRSFESQAGRGLYLSLLIPESILSIDADYITPVAAAALLSALLPLIDGSDKSPFIKWVNDIYIGDKKIAGILTERCVARDRAAYIIGIGINLYGSDFSPELKATAASVEQMTGRRVDRAELLLRTVKKLIDALVNRESEELLTLYRDRSLPEGTPVTVYRAGYEKREARVIGLDEKMRLTVEYGDGSRESLISADLRIKL